MIDQHYKVAAAEKQGFLPEYSVCVARIITRGGTIIINKTLLSLLHSAILTALAGCAINSPGELGAATGAVNTGPKIDIEEIRAVLRCARNEVAVCIETDCNAEDYACAKREDIRSMLNPVIRQ